MATHFEPSIVTELMAAVESPEGRRAVVAALRFMSAACTEQAAAAAATGEPTAAVLELKERAHELLDTLDGRHFLTGMLGVDPVGTRWR